MWQKTLLIVFFLFLSPFGLQGSTAAPLLRNLSETDFIVRLHPENALYVGDLISFEVIAVDENLNLENQSLSIKTLNPETDIGSAGFHPFGIGGRYQATMWWAWDTNGLEPGLYSLEFKIGEGLSWQEEIRLLPESDKPALETNTGLSLAETDCCLIYYYNNSSAAIDIDNIIEEAEKEAAAAIQKMGVDFTEPIEMLLMPRVLGHGGFAGGELYISYLDRNYAGDSLQSVLHHEMIHELDSRAGGDFRPTMLVEGMAVYQTGGHFKTEPLYARSVALVQLGWYIPLPTLAEGFYFQQHEITYMQAAALVEFMVERWGYDAYDAFYRDIHPPEDGLNGTAISESLENHFDLTLKELDALFYAALLGHHVPSDMLEDVVLSVEFFDTVRRYQLHLDQSAYFLTAWLPSLYSMIDREFYADLLRHPDDQVNLILETMLISVNDNLEQGKYHEADRLLGEINTILLTLEVGETVDWNDYSLADQYYEIIELISESDYTPKRLVLNEASAQVLVIDPGRTEYVRILIDLVIQNEAWQVVDITVQ